MAYKSCLINESSVSFYSACLKWTASVRESEKDMKSCIIVAVLPPTPHRSVWVSLCCRCCCVLGNVELGRRPRTRSGPSRPHIKSALNEIISNFSSRSGVCIMVVFQEGLLLRFLRRGKYKPGGFVCLYSFLWSGFFLVLGEKNRTQAWKVTCGTTCTGGTNRLTG